MRHKFLLACIVATALLSATPASADDREYCKDFMRTKANTAQEVISACTRLINSGRVKGDDLGQLYWVRGDRYFMVLQDFDRAIADQSQAIKHWSASANPDIRRDLVNQYSRLAWMRQLKGDHDRAIADATQAIKHAPTDGYGYSTRATSRLAKGDLGGALSDLSESIQWGHDVDRPGLYLRRAEVHERKGDVNSAIEDYRTAIKLGKEQRAKGTLWPWSDENNNKAGSRLAALGGSLNVATPKVEQPTLPLATPVKPTPPAAPLPAALSTAPVEFGRRVALIVGNSAYRTVAGLQNPPRDAEAVSTVLRNLRFHVVRMENDLTREKLVSALRTFEEEAEKSDWAVIYYSGHGIEVGGTNYLVPVDARLKSDKDVRDEAVPLDRVLSAVEGAKKLRVIILDACRENPFASQMRRTVASRNLGRGFVPIEPDVGTLVVYAAKHGEIAFDGEGANSPFASALIHRIGTPGLEIRRLFDVVRDDVLAATKRRQMPFTYGSVTGGEEFFFLPK